MKQQLYDEWKELVCLEKLVKQRKRTIKKQLNLRDKNHVPFRSPESLHREIEMANRYKSGETLQEIANDYGITRERVRQLLKRVGITGSSLGRYNIKEETK